MTAAPHRAISLAIGGFIAMAAAMGIGRFVYTPILPFMAEGIGLTKPQAGLIASANFLGYLLGALAAASPFLPGGKRGWFIAALAGSALSTAAMGLVSTVPAFLLLRLAGGIASAFVLVFASALVLERLAAMNRPGLSALHFAGVGTGIALSALMIGGLDAAGLDWRAQWLASGGLTLLALLAAVRLVPPDAATPAAAPAAAGVDRNDRRMIRLVLAYGLFGFGYVITATFISTIARATPALQAVEPLVWLVVGLAAIPSVGLWVAIGRRLGNDASYALASLTQAIAVALSVLVANAPALLAAALLLGGTIMGLTALGLIQARQLARGDPRQSLALMTAAFGLGQMIGPSFAGYAYALTGSFRAPSLAAAAALVIAAALVGLPLRRHRL
ncbi:MAG TPA: YbfB/YjiJ family MFS transporter [Dongiaceae bacterium]